MLGPIVAFMLEPIVGFMLELQRLSLGLCLERSPVNDGLGGLVTLGHM